MDDLIRRSGAIAAIHDYWTRELEKLPIEMTEDGEVYGSDYNSVLRHNKELSNTVKSLTPVDAVEMRHGHWYDIGSLSCRCSECGCKNNRESAYCPNCGAKMDGKNNALSHKPKSLLEAYMQMMDGKDEA